MILPYWRRPIEVESKNEPGRPEGESPVTIADRNAEQAMRTLIESRYPKHGIYGEELGSVRTDAEFVWVLDPIDGTKSFITGKPLFGTLIGLCHNGTPAIVRAATALDRLHSCGNDPSTLRLTRSHHRRARRASLTSACSRSAGWACPACGSPSTARRSRRQASSSYRRLCCVRARERRPPFQPPPIPPRNLHWPAILDTRGLTRTVCCGWGVAADATTPHMFADGFETERFGELRAAVKRPLYGCDCYAYALVASGFGADLVVEADLGLYDYAALVPVLLGGGGCMSDWNGTPLTIAHHEASKGRVCASANAQLHAAAIAVLRTDDDADSKRQKR